MNAIVDDLAERDRRRKNAWQVKWAEVIGNGDCPLMVRWVIVTPLGSLRLHHFLRGDADRDRHDHPWWFLTLVLRGTYEDDSELDGQPVRDHLRPGSVRFRPALHRHQVQTAGCWTIVITGRIGRRWGFWEHGIFRPVAQYFMRYGYVACADIDERGRMS